MCSRVLCEEIDGLPSRLPMLVKKALTVAQASSCPCFVCVLLSTGKALRGVALTYSRGRLSSGKGLVASKPTVSTRQPAPDTGRHPWKAIGKGSPGVALKSMGCSVCLYTTPPCNLCVGLFAVFSSGEFSVLYKAKEGVCSGQDFCLVTSVDWLS